jgi:hypothetical protein
MVNSLHRAGIEVLLLLVLNRLYKIAIRQIRSRRLAPQPIRVYVRLELLSLLKKSSKKSAPWAKNW